MNNEELEKYIKSVKNSMLVFVAICTAFITVCIFKIQAVHKTQKVHTDWMLAAGSVIKLNVKDLNQYRDNQQLLLDHLNLRIVETPEQTVPAERRIEEKRYFRIWTTNVFITTNFVTLPTGTVEDCVKEIP